MLQNQRDSIELIHETYQPFQIATLRFIALIFWDLSLINLKNWRTPFLTFSGFNTLLYLLYLFAT